MADETQLCSNCKRDVSTTNFVMHEMHCRRHIVLCEHCGEPVHRAELEQHFSDLHAQVPCEKCQKLLSKSDMDKHLKEDCSKKLMGCEYCELSLHKNEMEAHLDYCGSRTECCPLCQQYIMQKDKLRHESSGCTYPEPKSQPADPYRLEELEQMMTNAVLGNHNFTGAYFRQGKIPTNKRTELNAQRAKNVLIPEIPNESFNPVSSDVDYDTMLALQLAHEDWLLDGGIETHGHEVGGLPSYSEEGHYGFDKFGGILDDGGQLWSDLLPLNKSETSDRNSRVAAENDEDMSIPCEFCEAVVPLSVYIVHMECCPAALQRNATDLNNEQVSVPQISSRSTIPVINNLRPSEYLPEYQQLFDVDGEVEDFMLPCEFCQESFPSDVIIQHQSVCQADRAVTSRETSPMRNHRQIKPQQSSNQTSFNPTSRSPPRRKVPAASSFPGKEDSGDFVNWDSTNVRTHSVTESSSNKYSPAYNRFDKAITRPPRRPSRQPVSEPTTDNLEAKRESRSVQRARESLNQLLQEDTSAETVDQGAARRKPAALGAYDTNRADPKERRTRIDSRTVIKRLEESRQKPTQASSSKTPLSQNVFSPGRGDQPALTQQTRQRMDHVFSPELRLKPSNSSPPKKR
ncbi:unnamed protein product [Candidula unifasciata]|uniref:TRAF-type domain-containing protein n=1 Tax=Candidula unifasciata TaxID=100452 RepID=A0A8S3ZKD2_9EUPU|nr:unnamed protein product [Candidula unifasciata]